MGRPVAQYPARTLRAGRRGLSRSAGAVWRHPGHARRSDRGVSRAAGATPMRPAALFAATLAAGLAGCATAEAPGLGWSRAPDLSVYSAMVLYADVARERSALCSGNGSAWIERNWQR